MPCYDKKLEASRQGAGERDVDCVITTGELVQMMPNMPDMPDVPDAVGGGCRADIPDLVHHPGTSSGSYLHSVISTIASSSASPLDLSVRAVRSSDSEEYVLEDRQTGQVVFRGAKCYGFRNIQNLVRKLRRGKAGYDYVEVMACPGGCVNGGGQLKPPDKAWSTSVENAYWHDLSTHTPDVLASQMLVDLCQPTAHATGPKTWATCMDADAEARRTRLFRTEYQAVDSQVSGLAINW
jgi:iron only hydrogenase large subunit-like protein